MRNISVSEQFIGACAKVDPDLRFGRTVLAGCLRTPRGGSSKQIVFVAGEGKIRMRWMNPREYARLQGCPDYPITVDRNEALWGFGDAVCVPVIGWIAENVLSQLFPSSAGVRERAQAAGD